MIDTIKYVGHVLLNSPEFRRRPLPVVARLALWVVRRRLGYPNVIPFYDSQRASIVLPTDDWATFAIRKLRPLDKELLWARNRLRPGMVAIDVGAHHGVWTLAMAERVMAQGRVVAFEPASSSAARVKASIDFNGMTHVKLLEAAVSDRVGRDRLYCYPGDSTMNSLIASGERYETVDVTTIDEMSIDLDLQRVDIMKVDAEGNDARVIRGAAATISVHRPVVIFEVNKLRARALGIEPDEGWRLLRDLGYEAYVVNSKNQLECLGGTIDFERTDGHWNLVAIHPTSALFP